MPDHVERSAGQDDRRARDAFRFGQLDLATDTQGHDVNAAVEIRQRAEGIRGREHGELRKSFCEIQPAATIENRRLAPKARLKFRNYSVEFVRRADRGSLQNFWPQRKDFPRRRLVGDERIIFRQMACKARVMFQPRERRLRQHQKIRARRAPAFERGDGREARAGMIAGVFARRRARKMPRGLHAKRQQLRIALRDDERGGAARNFFGDEGAQTLQQLFVSDDGGIRRRRGESGTEFFHARARGGLRGGKFFQLALLRRERGLKPRPRIQRTPGGLQFPVPKFFHASIFIRRPRQ